jgi:two-component system, sensor histidine kinase
MKWIDHTCKERENQMMGNKKTSQSLGTDLDDLHSRIDPLGYTVKINRFAAVAGLCFFSLAITLVWQLFRAIVPVTVMTFWITGCMIFLFSWFIFGIALLSRNPDDPQMVKIWDLLATYVRIGSNLIVLTTIWMFLPFASRDLQLVMTVFYVAHVPTQILTVPARGKINATGAFAVLGSLAIVNVLNGGEYAIPIAIFVTAFAILMMNLALILGRLISNVNAERRQSDEIALRLERAHSEVAAERDAKTRFIAAASHDLGQPLQAASLFFDQVISAQSDPVRNKAIEGVRRAFASADQLLSHMLNHLRLEADAVTPHSALIEVVPLFTRLASQFAPSAQLAGIEIKVMPTRARLKVDRVLLDRAIGNLIDNGIQHSGASRIAIGARSHGKDRVRLWIIDNGKGVSTVDAPRIFEDYYRGTESRESTKSGFGLGLASVRRIAALMDGKAGIDLRWKNGSAFYLEFPKLTKDIEDQPLKIKLQNPKQPRFRRSFSSIRSAKRC